MMAGVWVTCNVRGLGRAEKRKALRLALDRVHPEVVLLQETKLRAGQVEFLGGWLRVKRLEACSLPAINAAGGLMTLWRKDIYACEEVVRGERFLLVVLQMIRSVMSMDPIQLRRS